MMNNVSNGIDGISLYIKLLIVALYILSFVVLIVSFSAIFNERRGEFAMMRVIGATKVHIACLAALESFIISSIASALGTLLSLSLLMLFDQAIISSLSLPYLSPSILWVVLVAFLSFVGISLIAPLSTLKTVLDFSRKEIALTGKGV